MKHSIPFLALCLLLLSACMPEQPTITIPPPSGTVSGFSGALNRLATQTQVAALTTTAESQRVAPTLEEMIAFTPSPLPSLPPLLDNIGPFQQVSRQEAPIIGKVINLQTPLDGSLLLLSESGYSQFIDGNWVAYFIGETGNLVGIDSTERAWAAAHDGSNISRWESRADFAEVWITYSENEGWLPPDNSTDNPLSPGLFEDSSGNLWVVTAQDVRRFNGTRWEAFDSQSLGMQPIADGSNANFTIQPVPGENQVYVGRCDWGSSGITGGGGIRTFDGVTWTIPDPALETGCITAITQAATGNLWLARDDGLYRVNPSQESLQQVPLPEAPPQTHFGYTIALTPAPDGSLWAQFALCDDLSCFGGTALYNLRDGLWQMVGEPSQSGGQKMLFDAAGNTWVLSAGSINKVEGNDLQAVPGLTVLTAATDSSGKLWLIAQSAGPPTLWTQP